MIQQINTENPSKFRSDDSVPKIRSSRPEVFLRKGVLNATLLKSHFGMGVLL